MLDSGDGDGGRNGLTVGGLLLLVFEAEVLKSLEERHANGMSGLDAE